MAELSSELSVKSCFVDSCESIACKYYVMNTLIDVYGSIVLKLLLNLLRVCFCVLSSSLYCLFI